MSESQLCANPAVCSVCAILLRDDEHVICGSPECVAALANRES